MSQNKKIAQEFYKAFTAGDMDQVFARLDENIEWVYNAPQELIPVGGTHHGKAGVQEFLKKVSEDVEFLSFEMTEFLADDDKVIALGHERHMIKPTGRIFQGALVWVFTIKDGLIQRFSTHVDGAAIAEAYKPTLVNAGTAS